MVWNITEEERQDLWKRVMAMKANEPTKMDICNVLGSHGIQTVLQTIKYFRNQPEDWFIQQVGWDLSVAQYRIFDWMGMYIDGMNRLHKNEDEKLANITKWIMVQIAEAFISAFGNTDVWITHLQTHDYALDLPEDLKFNSTIIRHKI